MSNNTLTLTNKEVLRTAEAGLAAELELYASGYKCRSSDLYQVLIGASVQRSTIEAVCREWLTAPGSNSVRGYLQEQLEVVDLAEWEARLNRALVANLPRRLWRKVRVLVMDMHDRPYYGKTEQEEGLWVRGRAKAGTTRFYRIATVYVVLKGLRFTLGIHFVKPEDTIVAIVQILMGYVAQLELSCKYWLFDRGFAGIEVQNYLDEQGVPAIIACPIRGKTGGTRALCQGRKSYLAQHTFQSQGGKLSRTADIAVCRTYTTAKRTKRLKRRATWQLFILIHVDMQPQQVLQVYGYRFGIETSYRCANQVRGWTTSANPVLRFLLMALALYLLNVWVYLRWCFTQIPRRGGRKLNVKLFQLSRFAHFIMQALEIHYGVVSQITAIAPPLLCMNL